PCCTSPVSKGSADDTSSSTFSSGPCLITRMNKYTITAPKMTSIVENVMSENKTLPADTFGDTASDVFIKPFTTHGCLPISDIIQPNEFPINGRKITGTMSIKYFLLPMSFLLKDKNNPRALNNSNTPPVAAIIRKLQNVV